MLLLDGLGQGGAAAGASTCFVAATGSRGWPDARRLPRTDRPAGRGRAVVGPTGAPERAAALISSRRRRLGGGTRDLRLAGQPTGGAHGDAGLPRGGRGIALPERDHGGGGGAGRGGGRGAARSPPA